VVATPETRYLKSDDVHIAYQLAGDGTQDLVYLSSWDFGIDCHWDEPSQLQFFGHLASLGRLVLFDKRGTGASDSVSLEAMPTLESWVDDVQVVMDHIGSERAAIVAPTWAGPLGILFAATCPERTSALVLIHTFARYRIAPDYPWGSTDERSAETLSFVEHQWGTGDLLTRYAPSLAQDDRLRRWYGRCNRQSISPATAVAFTKMNMNSDVRSVLPSIQAPTLVVYGPRDPLDRHGQYLAAHIPNAKTVEVDTNDTLPWLSDTLAGDIEEFLTGARRAPDSDRILATVVFTDLVGSTQRAAALGDRRWRELLDQYDVLVERHIGQFRGRLIKSTGDGTLATFDGPARAVRFAQGLRDSVRGLGVDLRCGVHTGEIEVRGSDIGGLAVHIGQRVSAMAPPGEVLVSRTVVDLVAGSAINFNDRGEHELKGVPGAWKLYLVEG
jgi:class 3 adenylate cyclase